MTIPITFRQLAYFVAVAERGTVSEAAKACNVSQPSVSAAVLQLEELIGERLFHRRQGEGMSLTPRGRKCVHEARELLARAASFMVDDEDESATMSGELSLAYFKDLGPYFVPRLISSFGKFYPKIEISLVECTLGDVQQALASGNAELAVTYNLNLRNDTERKVLTALPPYALLSAQHPLAGQEKIALAELAGEPLILEDLPVTLEYFQSLFWSRQLQPNVKMRTPTFEMQRGLVAHGLGVALSFTRPKGDMSYDGEPIRCIPLADDIPPHQVVLAGPNESRRSRIANKLWEFVIDASALAHDDDARPATRGQ